MTKYLKKYIREVEIVLRSESGKNNWRRLLENHRAVVSFMQHERLIHLLVTLMVGLAFVILVVMTLVYQIDILKLGDLLLFVLLVPYILHYFNLENGVQKLYWLDREIVKRLNGGND